MIGASLYHDIIETILSLLDHVFHYVCVCVLLSISGHI